MASDSKSSADPNASNASSGPGGGGDDNNQAEANVRRALRRGNINFEFLDPRAAGEATEGEAVPRTERRSGERKDKRGLFNRGRPARPVTRTSQFFWAVLGALSVAGMTTTFLYADSVIYLLGLPVFVASFFWSLMMLALFAARPR